MSYFIDTPVNIYNNKKLRTPQIEAYIKIQEFFSRNPTGEAKVVLPTGTGKSGLLSIAPYGICQKRVLIITPGLVTLDSIRKTLELIQDNFLMNFDVIFNPRDIPVLTRYASDLSDEHLQSSHIVYSNIQKLGKGNNRGLLNREIVDPEFFDLIIIDEAHHAPANSWVEVLQYFESAKKLFVTATPYRGDNLEVPGVKIHETPLSEVMRDRYVKWLRKETVNASELYFTIPEQPESRLSINDVLQFKEKEWIEKSVALSKECSLDVIQYSIQKLKDLKQTSPNVPHKIMAVGCSINHAEDLLKWYEEQGFSCVIVHSQMQREDKEKAFNTIEQHKCDVVISVNMLMEGYDHRYLTILAIFRPYRSLNAFAQVVGRVLRSIPNDEITAFEIDNNAVVIYHQETGLDAMWNNFQKEVDRAKRPRLTEIMITDREYTERDNSLANVSSNDSFLSDKTSYLDDIDFNELFERKREEIKIEADKKLREISESSELSPSALQQIKDILVKEETNKVSAQIDQDLIDKRPDLARKELRKLLKSAAENEVADLLCEIGIDEKGTELTGIFERHIPYLNVDSPNDGTLVRYVNLKLLQQFGKVDKRDNNTLKSSLEAIPQVVDELRRMLK